ncbi:MAG TPA: kelch repeat-containing protein [Longimicrobium sp.]
MKLAAALATAFISARVGGPGRRALEVAALVVLAACGGDGGPTPLGPATNGSIRGTVTDNTGATVANAAVALTGSGQAPRTTNSGADGVYTFADVPPGTYTLAVTPPTGFAIGLAGTASVTVAGGAQADASGFVLYRVAVGPGEWGLRAQLIQPNSELALAESNGKLYLMGGYPPSRVTARTVQVYDIANNSWALGPQLPQPNNHGMAAAVNGKIYLIGGQLTADQEGYVDTVYELDPATGAWVEKARMPTARSGGVAVVHDGKIYVAGGRVPRGSDFAVYDPAADRWEALPDLPSQRNHITGAAINGRIHVVGGRLGNGLSPLKTTAHEVFDPQTRTWTTAAPMLSGRSGINGVMARGCFHVWGGEAPTGMTPQHEYYDPRTNQWSSLPTMPIPIHGVVGSAFVDGLIWVSGGGTQIGGSFGSLLNQVYRPAVSCE